MEKIFDWGRFIRRLYLKTDTKTVFNFIATSQGLSIWFLQKANYLSSNGTLREKNELAQKNDRYDWTWFYKNHNLKGKVLDINNSDFIKLTFGSSIVSFEIKSTNGNNLLLELIQTEKTGTDTQFGEVDCFATWTFFLTNLKSVIEHGIDLRDKNPTIEGLTNR